MHIQLLSRLMRAKSQHFLLTALPMLLPLLPHPLLHIQLFSYVCVFYSCLSSRVANPAIFPTSALKRYCGDGRYSGSYLCSAKRLPRHTLFLPFLIPDAARCCLLLSPERRISGHLLSSCLLPPLTVPCLPAVGRAFIRLKHRLPTFTAAIACLLPPPAGSAFYATTYMLPFLRPRRVTQARARCAH